MLPKSLRSSRPSSLPNALPKRVLFFVLCVLAAFSAEAQKSNKYDRLDLTNLLLGPEYSQWLVGPLARIAGDAEREQYLTLTNDASAEDFVVGFWSKRSELKSTFDRRAEEADKRYTEGTFAGSRTDRGTIYILYGEPDTSEYEEHRDVDDPDVERWTYPKSADKGLDGRKPRRQYRFAREGELTEFFVDTGVDKRRRTMEQRLRPTRPARPFR